MKRRTSLGLIAGLSTTMLVPDVYGFNPHNNTEWFNSFSKRWTNSKIYTYEIFDAMPPDSFDFQPALEMMSYAKLFTHIGHGLEIFAEKLDGIALSEEPETTNKQELKEYLDFSFERFDNAYKKLDQSTLYTNKHHFSNKDHWKNVKIIDILLLAYNHTIHHRGQATTYLRLKGIEPSKYMF